MPESDLLSLMRAGYLPPLCYYFARFVARGIGEGPDGVLGRSAALVSLRNLAGDVCVDLAQHAGRPLLEADPQASICAPRNPPLDTWTSALRACDWVGGPGDPHPLILDATRLYLGKYWGFEHGVAQALIQRMGWVQGLDLGRLRSGLQRLFSEPAPHPVDWQRVAAAIAAGRRLAVISGGPGTGKTTTVVKVLALLLEQDPGLRMALAAPTGKAAARLAEAVRSGKARIAAPAEVLDRIPGQAATIHRLLGMRGQQGFRHHAGNPLLLDCLVIDEASMVDLPLMARLLAALPAETHLILLGDRDQLASVEAGNVLGDITGHGLSLGMSPEQAAWLESVGAAEPGVLKGDPGTPPAADCVGLLRHSFRFSSEGGIGALARAVNEGDVETALRLVRASSGAPRPLGAEGADGALGEVAWDDTAGADLAPTCLAWALSRYAGYLQASDVATALDLLERSRVLAALHRGPFGVETLNRRIAEGLQGLGLITGGEEYHGKPVMVTANDYEVGLFNGDVGLLWRDGDGALRAWFPLADGAPRSVSLRQLPQHVPAYALTVHKSQGSEFDAVYLVLPQSPSPVVTRELIYTGITRARRSVTIQGDPESFALGCRARIRRGSGLAERLGWPRVAD